MEHYRTYRAQLWDECSAWLKTQGIDLVERHKGWCTHTFDEASFYDGPFRIKEWLHDERRSPELVNVFEIPRTQVMK